MQSVIMVAGSLLFVAMSLFPPWNAVIKPPLNNETVFLGYSFISNPPHSPFGFDSYIIINYFRLLVQWILLATTALLVYSFLKYKIDREKV